MKLSALVSRPKIGACRRVIALLSVLAILATTGSVLIAAQENKQVEGGSGHSKTPASKRIDLIQELNGKKLKEGENLVYQTDREKIFAEVKNDKIIGWHAQHNLILNACTDHRYPDRAVCCTCVPSPPYDPKLPKTPVCYVVECVAHQ